MIRAEAASPSASAAIPTARIASAAAGPFTCSRTVRSAAQSVPSAALARMISAMIATLARSSPPSSPTHSAQSVTPGADPSAGASGRTTAGSWARDGPGPPRRAAAERTAAALRATLPPPVRRRERLTERLRSPGAGSPARNTRARGAARAGVRPPSSAAEGSGRARRSRSSSGIAVIARLGTSSAEVASRSSVGRSRSSVRPAESRRSRSSPWRSRVVASSRPSRSSSAIPSLSWASASSVLRVPPGPGLRASSWSLAATPCWPVTRCSSCIGAGSPPGLD